MCAATYACVSLRRLRADLSNWPTCGAVITCSESIRGDTGLSVFQLFLFYPNNSYSLVAFLASDSGVHFVGADLLEMCSSGQPVSGTAIMRELTWLAASEEGAHPAPAHDQTTRFPSHASIDCRTKCSENQARYVAVVVSSRTSPPYKPLSGPAYST